MSEATNVTASVAADAESIELESELGSNVTARCEVIAAIAEDKAAQVEPTRSLPGRWRAVQLGTCFLFLFAGYGPAASLAPALFGGVGFTSLALVYGFLAAASFISPLVVTSVGIRISLVGSAVVYALFVGCVGARSVPALLIASAFVGVAAAVIWNAQGILIAALAQEPKHVGRLNGIFFALYGCGPLLGNTIVGSITLHHAERLESGLLVLLALAVIGTIMFLGVANETRQSGPGSRASFFFDRALASAFVGFISQGTSTHSLRHRTERAV